MDDLISRKAAIKAAKHAWSKGIEPSQYIEIIPTVHSVSLDKLCEWMALRFGYPCQIIDDCNGWYVSDCVSHDGNKVACWGKVLTKWMEGLNEAD